MGEAGGGAFGNLSPQIINFGRIKQNITRGSGEPGVFVLNAGHLIIAEGGELEQNFSDGLVKSFFRFPNIINGALSVLRRLVLDSALG